MLVFNSSFCVVSLLVEVISFRARRSLCLVDLQENEESSTFALERNTLNKNI